MNIFGIRVTREFSIDDVRGYKYRNIVLRWGDRVVVNSTARMARYLSFLTGKVHSAVHLPVERPYRRIVGVNIASGGVDKAN